MLHGSYTIELIFSNKENAGFSVNGKVLSLSVMLWKCIPEKCMSIHVNVYVINPY